MTSLLTRRLRNETSAFSAAAAAQRSPQAAAQQSQLHSDLNVFMACDFDKDEHSACFMAYSMQMNKANDC